MLSEHKKAKNNSLAHPLAYEHETSNNTKHNNFTERDPH